MGKKYFIRDAIKHPGALKRYAKRHHESTGRAIQQGLKSKNPTLRKRANLAKTLGKLRKRKRR